MSSLITTILLNPENRSAEKVTAHAHEQANLLPWND